MVLDVTQFKFEFPHYIEYVKIGCDVGLQVTVERSKKKTETPSTEKKLHFISSSRNKHDSKISFNSQRNVPK